MCKILPLLSTLLLLVACPLEDCSSPSAPDNGGQTTTTIPVEPTPQNYGIDFAWDNVRGALYFAATQGTEGELMFLINEYQSAWPGKQFTLNTCSETSGWKNSMPRTKTEWAKGPAPLSQENRDNLQRFLRVTAEMGILVRLNIFCSVRDDIAWMDLNAEDYARQVAEDVRDFNHVFLSISNEPIHPGSWFNQPNTMARLSLIRDIARDAGFLGMMGTDDGIRRGGGVFEYAYRNLFKPSTPDFHPYRNPDPSTKVFRRMVKANGLPTVISESTCYSKWRENDGLCTDDKFQLTDTMCRAERAGITYFTHSTDGLQWPQKLDIEWIPVASCAPPENAARIPTGFSTATSGAPS